MNIRMADRHRTPAPVPTVGQEVWLSTQDIALQGTSKKLAPMFVGPLPIINILNLSTVKLQLPRSMHIHPTFHVSQIKPVVEGPLNPPANTVQSSLMKYQASGRSSCVQWIYYVKPLTMKPRKFVLLIYLHIQKSAWVELAPVWTPIYLPINFTS